MPPAPTGDATMADPRDIAHEHSPDCGGPADRGWHTSRCKMLAAAITAAVEQERERCAKFIEDGGGGWLLRNSRTRRVAKALRNLP